MRGLGLGLGFSPRQQAAAAAAAYHPNDDLATWEMYAIAEAADITVATGAERWNWRGSVEGFFKQATAGNQPAWDATGTLTGHGCLVFDGSDDFMAARNASDDGDLTATEIATATTGIGTMIVVCYPTAAVNASATAYENDCIIADADIGFGGISIHSTPSVRAWAWDGTVDRTNIAFAVPGGYVFTRRKEAATLYGAVNGGEESSVASGNVGGLSGIIRIGDIVGSAPFTGELYLVAATKTDVGAVALAAIATRLMDYFGIA